MADVADVLYRGQQEFTKMDEEAKRINDSAKAADAFMKANPELLGQLGLSAEQWRAGGSRDRAAAFTGLMQSQGYRKAQAEQAQLQEHIQASQSQRAHLAELIKASQQQREEDTAAGDLLRNFSLGQSGTASAASAPADLSSLLAAQPPPPDSANTLDPQLRALLTGPYPTGPAPSVPSAPVAAPAAGDFQSRLRYALGNTPGLGGKGIRGLLEGIAQLQKVQENEAGSVTPPVVNPMPGGYNAYGWPGTKQRGIYPDLSQGAQVVQTEAGPVIMGPKGQLVQPHEASAAAQQQNADTTTLHQSEIALQGIERAIGAWNAQAADAQKDPKSTPAPDPATLKNLQQRRTNLLAIVERVGAALAGGSAAAPPPQVARSERVTVIGTDGKRYTVPRSQLEAAKRQGYRPAP